MHVSMHTPEHLLTSAHVARSQGTLYKYQKLVSDASHGAVTDLLD